ncbi:MAG TPA: hypothetical protein PLF61_00285 [Candidatus Goldiibacteriota bacterium]|nr:hypothetical protein [Candidatus Goldiibacteriota bacterium]
MKKFKIIMCLYFIFFTFSAYCKNNKEDYLKDVIVLLPSKSKIKFDWVVPPAKEKQNAGCIFKMDNKGTAWFAFDGRYILNPNNGFLFKVKEQFDDFILTGNSKFLFIYKDYLCFIPSFDTKKIKENSLPLQPLAKLPARNCRLYSGYDNVYVSGKNQNKNEIYVVNFKELQKMGDAGKVINYKKLFTTEKNVSAVAGDGRDNFFAIDNLVVYVSTGIDKVSGYFLSPEENITGLAYDKTAGLFYCTKRKVGYVNKNGNLDFLYVKNPAIFVSDGNLYVYIPENDGLLRIKNIPEFKTCVQK